MIEWGVAAGVVLGVATLALRTVLPHVFTSDPAVVDVAAFLLVFVAVDATGQRRGVRARRSAHRRRRPALPGRGDARVVRRVPAVSRWPCRSLGLGIGWLWTALFVFMVARMVTLGVRWAGDRWAVTGADR